MCTVKKLRTKSAVSFYVEGHMCKRFTHSATMYSESPHGINEEEFFPIKGFQIRKQKEFFKSLSLIRVHTSNLKKVTSS